MSRKILTTVIGSYPIPDWLAAYPSEASLRDAIAAVIKIQEAAGIDVITDGELHRFDINHPESNGIIDYFINRISGIRTQLAEAASLRAEAQKLRDEYAKKSAQADEEIAAIRAAAEKQAAEILEQAKADATALIERHKTLAADKIAAAERAAVEELRAAAADAATAAARDLLGKELDEAADRKLVDKAIAGI